jgi:hypothetical protein
LVANAAHIGAHPNLPMIAFQYQFGVLNAAMSGPFLVMRKRPSADISVLMAEAYALSLLN